jgi:hypothetical protein
LGFWHTSVLSIDHDGGVAQPLARFFDCQNFPNCFPTEYRIMPEALAKPAAPAK